MAGICNLWESRVDIQHGVWMLMLGFETAGGSPVLPSSFQI